MARCEDFPCCNHERGCCPDYDPDTGEQLNMKCTCGATVPLSSRSSLCESCLNPGRARMRARAEARANGDLPCDCSDKEDHEEDCENHPEYEAEEDGWEEDYGDREFEQYGYDYPDY